jgi:hypothetical protein
MPKVLIRKQVRTLVKGEGSSRLYHSGISLDEDTEIDVGEPETCHYDHDILPAVPFMWGGKEHYLLERDINPEYWGSAGFVVGDSPLV